MENRRILIAGATGLVGAHILEYLLRDSSVSEIHLLSRRDLTVQHNKLTVHVVDFKAIPALPPVDETYLALGTTIKQAGGRDAFKKVDLEANFAVAEAGLTAGAKRLGLVSAMSANVSSLLFYNRVKGQLEDKLSMLPFESFVIARPSFLLGDRKKLNQSQRNAEKIGILLFKLLGPLLPVNLRAVDAYKVALSLVSLVPQAVGKKIIESGNIQKFSLAHPPVY